MKNGVVPLRGMNIDAQLPYAHGHGFAHSNNLGQVMEVHMAYFFDYSYPESWFDHLALDPPTFTWHYTLGHFDYWTGVEEWCGSPLPGFDNSCEHDAFVQSSGEESAWIDFIAGGTAIGDSWCSATSGASGFYIEDFPGTTETEGWWCESEDWR